MLRYESFPFPDWFGCRDIGPFAWSGAGEGRRGFFVWQSRRPDLLRATQHQHGTVDGGTDGAQYGTARANR